MKKESGKEPETDLKTFPHVPVQNNDDRSECTRLSRNLTIVFGLLAILTALLGLIGMRFGIILISSVYPGYRTIALSAALIWMVTGSILVMNATRLLRGTAVLAAKLLLAVIVIAEMIELPLNFLGTHSSFELWLIETGKTILGPSSAPMSPVASVLIILSALSLFFIVQDPGGIRKNRRIADAAGITGLGIAVVSFTFVLSYAFGDPLLYGTQVIPIAALSALAAFFTGAGLVTAAGPAAFPLKYITGNSTRDHLLRIFVPLVVVIILVEQVLFSTISARHLTNDAILMAASLILFALVTGYLVSRISGVLGSALNRAETELVQKNEDIGAMNEELMAIEEELRQNIDELGRSGEALKESEEKYRTIVETANEGIWIVDAERRTTFVNERMARMLGCTPDEMIGRSYHDFVDAESAAISDQNFEERKKGIGGSMEYRLRKKDGSPLWTYLNSQPIFDKNGNFAGSLTMISDITARKQADDARQESEKQLRRAHDLLESVTRSSGVMIAAEDMEFRYTYFNKAYADEIKNLTGKELAIGMNMRDLFAHVPDEQANSVRQWRRVLSGRSVKDTVSLDNPGGGRRTYNVIHTPIRDNEGRVIGAGEVSYDVTRQIQIEAELRKTSQYLENLINYANAPIIVWDPEFRITRFNRAFERLTGRTAQEVIGQTPDILIPEKYHDIAMNLIKKATTGDRWEVVEIPILRSGGEIRTVLWNSATLYEDAGKTVIATIAQGQDITDRRHAEETTLSEKKKAEETLSLLNAALESTAEGIFVVDTTRKITSFNQNFISLWNITGSVLMTGDDRGVWEFLQLQVKEPAAFLVQVLDLYRYPGRESFDMVELNDGRIFERHSKPQKLRDKIIGRVWSYRDVTDRRRAEEKLIASVQEKETLIREIHHRVKNNLQIISGLLDMTRMRTPDITTNSILTDMMMKIKTMAQIHTRLYESKRFDKINMGSQIRDQVADLSSIYGRSGAEISSEIDAEDIYLPVDQAIPCALVVNEILSNAFKHAFRGKEHGMLRVSITRRDDHIRINIRDDGVGIPKDMDVYQTTSLGLKLIRSLVTQLNGSVTITSDHGTEVIVEFPLHAGGK
jgi:PAS domain S-box-containing protein